MVRKILMLMALWLMLPAGAFAASFTATTDSNQASVGQPITLQLTLSGTQPQGAPDTAALEKYFTIADREENTSTTIINGAVSSSVGWTLDLVPKKQGRLTIPAVTIETTDGTLSTQPIDLSVGKGASTVPGQNGSPAISVTAEADPQNPYKNQPIHYTVTVTSRSAQTKLSLQDISIENAIVDKPDKPKISSQKKNGEMLTTFEFDFVITPLQPGPVVIPPAQIEGQMAVMPEFPNMTNQDMNNPLAFLKSLNNMTNFGMAQSFNISSNEVDLDVRPPAVEMNPWLPLYALQITDEWSGLQNARAGEPLTRKIAMLAEGASGSQLPSLESYQNKADFKIYADKAVTKTDPGGPGDRISGLRTENYTLIPKKAGRLVLPAIKVPCWDIANERISYAELPEKVIDVQPGAAPAEPSPSVSPAASANPSTAQKEKPAAAPAQEPAPAAVGNNKIFYAIIAGLLAAVLFIAFWAWNLQRRIAALAAGKDAKAAPAAAATPPPPPAASPQERLAQISTPQDLSRFLQDYATQNWRAPVNAPLEKIFAAAPPGIAKNAGGVIRELTAALYAGREVDLESLKARIQDILSGAGKKKPKKRRMEKLPDLNPS